MYWLSPVKRKPLVLYITAVEYSLGALLTSENAEGKEDTLQCSDECRWTRGATFFHQESVLGSYICHLKAVVLSPAPSHQVDLKSGSLEIYSQQTQFGGMIVKWALLLQQYDIECAPHKAIKGQDRADFLVAHPVLDNSPLAMDFPDEESYWWSPRKDGRCSPMIVPNSRRGYRKRMHRTMLLNKDCVHLSRQRTPYLLFLPHN